jgi:ATP synthase protein I
MPEKEPEKPLFKQLLEASTVGIQLVLSTFAGFAIGYLLDKFFGSFPWLTAIFLLLGIAAGFYDLVKVARRQNGHDKKGS